MTEKLICPICNSRKFNSLSQDLHKCKSCAIVFNSDYKQLEYDEDYFNSDYEKQYGKTYLDDFPAIYELSNNRLDIILNILGKPGELKLLDIGSAMGFFLKCAKDRGIKNLLGIEISSFAGDYTSKEFKIDVIKRSFDKVAIDNDYDIISAWYFIEHCEEPLKMLEKIYSSLKPGGILAFSTPSTYGPQYFFKRSHWVKNHPDDHRVDFSPASVKKILKRIGFKKIILKPSGIHPERILKKSNIFYTPFSFLYVIFSKKFNFSDTLEIYAVK